MIRRAASLIAMLACTATTVGAATPNWSGLWQGGSDDPQRRNDTLLAGSPRPDQLPQLTPAYQAIYEENQRAMRSGDLTSNKTARCEPPGVPLNMAIPYGGEILMTEGRVTIITEWAGDVRRIFTDGRGHPADLDPSFQGHSVGRWEGRDLLVDTVAISTRASLNTAGAQQSESLHMTERFHEYKPGFLEISYRLEDSQAFVKPWEFKVYWRRNPDRQDYVHEFHCDNNRDAERQRH